MWICCVSITIYIYIYIYAGSYKYLKEKKKSNGRSKGKKNKKAVVTVATAPLNNPKWHCNNGLKLKKDGKKRKDKDFFFLVRIDY